MDILTAVNTPALLDALNDSIVIINQQGVIQYINRACAQLFQYEADELIDKNVTALMNNHDAIHHADHMKKYHQQKQPQIFRLVSGGPLAGKKKDGTLFPVEIKVSEFEDNGQFFYAAVMSDLSAITDKNEKLEHVLQHTDIVLYSLTIENDELNTRWVSPNIFRVLGYNVQEATRPNWWANSLHPDDKAQAFKNFDVFFQKGELKHEYRIRKKDGHYIWVEDQLKLNESTTPVTITGSLTDISERKHMIAGLLKNEERLSTSQVFANIGTWDWNIKTGDLFWSERIPPLFGYPPGELETSYENFVAALHPDDKPLVLDAINQCLEGGEDYDIDHRVVWPDGQIRWVNERGNTVRDDNGLPIHMLGVVTDIHRQKTLQLSESKTSGLLNDLNCALSIFATQKEIKKADDLLLQSLLNFTESEYGFIGEILYNEQNRPYLKTHAITNIAWNEETEQLYQEWGEKGFEFTNLDTLFGHVIKTGEMVNSNNPATDIHAGGLPEGHPPLNRFLGVPVFYGNELIGMYGLANRKTPYDKELIDRLSIFSATYSTIIQAGRSLISEEMSRKALVEAKEQAESANRAKSVFLSSMSHELRTPLNAILGFAQLLLFNAELDEESHANSQDIYNAGKHLLKLINEVLDLAKIESGHIDLDIKPISTTELFEEIQHLLSSLAEKHNVALLLKENCASNITIDADYTRIKQVMTNLVSNAIKYNKRQGQVEIKCELKSQRLYITVKDNGPGIAEEDIPKLFIPFNRLGEEKSSTIDGTGIGLVITRQLIQLMHGQLYVNSEVGKGSEFSFYVPVSRDQTPPAQNTQFVNTIERLRKKGSVVYIEDNPTNMNMIEQTIRVWTDLSFYSADMPEAGIELVNEIKPDVVLIDINLPGMSGYEVLEKLKQNPELSHTKMIAITANVMTADKKKISEAGFDGYIGKPVDLPKFMNCLREAFS